MVETLKNNQNVESSEIYDSSRELANLKNEIFETNKEKLDSMKQSKDVVDGVYTKLGNLVTLEKQLKEPSEYRDSLQADYELLKGYLDEMKKIIDKYSEGFDVGQKFDRKTVNNNVDKFKEYADKAKEIEKKYNIEKEIRGLLRDQDMKDQIDSLKRENEKLKEVNKPQENSESKPVKNKEKQRKTKKPTNNKIGTGKVIKVNDSKEKLSEVDKLVNRYYDLKKIRDNLNVDIENYNKIHVVKSINTKKALMDRKTDFEKNLNTFIVDVRRNIESDLTKFRDLSNKLGMGHVQRYNFIQEIRSSLKINTIR